jgi:single-strand DNA-binding protein
MASQGKNLVILIGNVGQDPETRHMPNGGAHGVALSVAACYHWHRQHMRLRHERRSSFSVLEQS